MQLFTSSEGGEDAGGRNALRDTNISVIWEVWGNSGDKDQGTRWLLPGIIDALERDNKDNGD